MTCRYVRVKKDGMDVFLNHMKNLFPQSLPLLSEVSNNTAFPVEYVDVDPTTGKKRLFLVAKNNLKVLGWVFEDCVEDVK